MKTLISLFAIPVIAIGSVVLISTVGGKSAIQQIQELRGVKTDSENGGED